jgi:hypothetical protein
MDTTSPSDVSGLTGSMESEMAEALTRVATATGEQSSFEISNIKTETVMDLDGNITEKPSAKKWALVEISLRIAQDETLINRVLKLCQKPGNHNMSLEDYILDGTRFEFFLKKFPDIANEFSQRLNTERQEKVLKVRESLKIGKRRNKKVRRK